MSIVNIIVGGLGLLSVGFLLGWFVMKNLVLHEIRMINPSLLYSSEETEEWFSSFFVKVYNNFPLDKS